MNCPKNNRCGINDCRGSHHFHLHFKRRSNPSERVVDAAVETRNAFGNSEFPGDVVRKSLVDIKDPLSLTMMHRGRFVLSGTQKVAM